MSNAFGQITAHRDVIYPRYDPQAFVGREWLINEVRRLRDDEGRRHLIIVGEPGSGKSAFLAYLAEIWNCPRYFIRADNIDGVTDVAPRRFLLSLGAQLYEKYGAAIFPRSPTGTTQVTTAVTSNQSEVVGRFIDELYTLPFLPAAERDITVRAGITTGRSRVIGEHVRRLIDVTEKLDELILLHVAVIQPLQKLQTLFPTERVLILIDALDESLQHPAPRIIDIIPRATDADLPPNLRLVMTSRNGDHLVRFRAQDLLYLDNREKGYWQENRRDTRIYVLKQLRKSPLTEIIGTWSEEEREAFITTLQDNSDGNFLFLHHFFNELFDAIAKGETDLKKIFVPKGIDEIYRYFAVGKIRDRISDSIQFTALKKISEELISQWQNLPGVKRVQVAGQEITLDVENINWVLTPLFSLPAASGGQITNLLIYQGAGGDAWETQYLPILGTLAVAYEALSREQLAGFAGVEAVFVDRVIAHLEQFLDKVYNERQNRYRIYHTSFSEYLLDSSRNRDYQLNGRIFHARIADYFLNGYRQWENVKWSLVEEDYPYHYLPLHLLEANRVEEFYTLINKGWMQAKLVRSHSYHSFSEDIRRAIRIAESEEPVNFAQVIRLSLIQVTLRSIANAVPAGLIGSLSYINKNRSIAISEGNAALIIGKEKQAAAYQMIGEAFLSRNNIEMAEINLMRAIKLAREIRNIYSQADLIQSLSQTVIKLSNESHLRELLNTVLAMSDAYLKASVLANIARMLADAGERSYALDVIQKALFLTKSFSDDLFSYRPYAIIAVALDHLKDRTKAEEVADLSISSTKSHPGSLNEVTGILLEMNESQKAIEVINQTQLVLETFPESRAKAEYTSVLAKYLARIGATERAVSTAESMLDWIRLHERYIMAGYEGFALSEIAQAFAILNEKERALKIANGALAASKLIGRLDQKAAVLIQGIVPAAVKIQSQQLLTQALQSMSEFMGSRRWEISEVIAGFNAICSAMVELDYHEGLNQTLQVAVEIADNWRRIAACGCVAQYMIKIGNGEGALEIADKIFAEAEQLFGDENDKRLCLGAIVMTYAQNCPQEKLLELLDVTETLGTGYKAAALATIASKLSQQDEKKQVNDLMDKVSKLIDSSFDGVSTRAGILLIGLFQALTKLGREEEITRLTRKLETQIGNIDIGEFILKVVRFAFIFSKDEHPSNLAAEIIERLENQRRNEFKGWVGRWDQWERGPLLGVLIKRLLELGFLNQVVEIVDQSVADSDANLSNPYIKAAVLNKAALVLSVAGRQREAQLKLLSAIAIGREWSRNTIFRAVEQNTETLAAIDHGETLWKIFEVIQEVDSWWNGYG
jgi:tetratricopeptide (TPR) repeat protein